MSTWLTENLVPEKAAEFRKADSQCFDSNADLFSFQDLGKYFKRGYSSLFDPIPRSVMASACMSLASLVFWSLADLC
jgi:hypothetical protein